MVALDDADDWSNCVYENLQSLTNSTCKTAPSCVVCHDHESLLWVGQSHSPDGYKEVLGLEGCV